MDASTRPEHAMLNGLVYRYDDPFWQSFYPPNGWRCRCRVVALSDYNVQKKNRTVSSSAGTLSEELALVSKKSGEYELVKALNAIGVTPLDLITILQALREAGSLQAEIQTI